MDKIKYLSLFSGIGGFEVGILQSKYGGLFENVGYSEIDKYAKSIYEKNFPDHINWGDATRIRTEDLPDFDFLVGGFPCQAFSVAGKRRGVDDTRGTLFFEIARILRDKRRIKREIITYICGGEGLSPEFIALLKAGGLSEKDGEILKRKLEDQIDSNYNLDLLFSEYYRKQLEDADYYPIDEMNEYTSDSQYLKLVKAQFPQSVDEACDILIGMLDEDDIQNVLKSDKFRFRLSQHFRLGMFIRNHFGINQSQSRTLMCDIIERSGKMLFLNDDVSGYLLDELWEEVQRRY